MATYKISFISDTHAKHNQIVTNQTLRKPTTPLDLPGGNILIHAGDFMTSGYSPTEAMMFFKWLNDINNYDTKVFIAGNHDRWMQDEPKEVRAILKGYETINYLEDDELVVNGDMPEDDVRIYGSPWQPEFFDWAFNLPRHSEAMKARWDAIPSNTDILVTHGPPFGYLDIPGGQTTLRVGCEMLRHRVDEIRPKIHVFGHIHGSYGHYFNGHTHFINASVLNERYAYENLPFTFEWDSITNEITWL